MSRIATIPPAQTWEKFPIIPTVFIGLGGTGKDVLNWLRYRIREAGEFDSEQGWGARRFLFLDTDCQSIVPSGSDPEEFSEIVPKRGTVEIVDCGITEAEIKNVHYQTRCLANSQFAWLHPQFFDAVGTNFPDSGTTNRQAGRLAFQLHVDQIREALVFQIRELRSFAGEYPEKVVHNRIEFVIVTSFAGRAGSGMFVDLSYLIRDIFQGKRDIEHPFQYDICQTETTLIGLLPKTFCELDPHLADRFESNPQPSKLVRMCC